METLKEITLKSLEKFTEKSIDCFDTQDLLLANIDAYRINRIPLGQFLEQNNGIMKNYIREEQDRCKYYHFICMYKSNSHWCDDCQYVAANFRVQQNIWEEFVDLLVDLTDIEKAQLVEDNRTRERHF